jgi:hypothetical protein
MLHPSKEEEAPRKKIDVTALQVAGVAAKDYIKVDDPRVLQRVAQDTRVAEMAKTMPPKGQRSVNEQHRIKMARRVTAQCHEQLKREQYDEKIKNSRYYEEFNADSGVLTVGQEGEDGNLVPVTAGQLIPATTTTLKQFCIARSREKAPDRTCLLIMTWKKVRLQCSSRREHDLSSNHPHSI